MWNSKQVKLIYGGKIRNVFPSGDGGRGIREVSEVMIYQDVFLIEK